MLRNEKAIERLKKDGEQLNRALNNLDATFSKITDMLDDIIAIDENTNPVLARMKLAKMKKEIEWEATKGMANMSYFALHEEIEKKRRV